MSQYRTAYLVLALLVPCCLLILEKFIAGEHVYNTVKASSSYSELAALIYAYGKPFSRIASLSLIVFIVLIFPRIQTYRERYIGQWHGRQLLFLLPQIALFLVFYALTVPAFQVNSIIIWQLLWLSSGLLCALTALLALAQPAYWRHILWQEKWLICLAFLISGLVWILGVTTQHLWTSMSDATFTLVAAGLSLISGDVYTLVDGAQKIIGIGDFLVNIAPECSGYEGIGLITAFTAVYLFSFRADFRFPMAYLLFPLAALVIWLFNALRIIILITIGTYWSPETAVWGFHSQAGWITFILTSVLIMWTAHKSRLFAKQSSTPKNHSERINLPMATLIPLIALLSSTLITQALSSPFDWLYPLRVVCTAIAIALCWKQLQLRPIKVTYWALVGGLAVTALWLLLAQPNPETDQTFSDALQTAPTLGVVAWLLFRLLGSAITVPIAEELGFRAYLLCQMSSTPVATQGRLTFSLIGFTVSSVAFGLLHGAWLAGTLAGAIYALVRYKSDHIADAIIAHSITNALLFAFAYYSGQWSLL